MNQKINNLWENIVEKFNASEKLQLHYIQKMNINKLFEKTKFKLKWSNTHQTLLFIN